MLSGVKTTVDSAHTVGAVDKTGGVVSVSKVQPLPQASVPPAKACVTQASPSRFP
jgi:hypothetical protein